jgi:DNA-binding beta-propeller fold protein YncE
MLTGRRILKAAGAALLASAAVLASLSFISPAPNPDSAPGVPSGSARLVSIEQLPESFDACAPGEADAGFSMIAAMEAEAANHTRWSFSTLANSSVHAAGQNGGGTVEITRPPVRTIRDTYPIFSSVAVDNKRNEVYLQDTNLFSIKVFDRTHNTPSNAEPSKPKRMIIGEDTKNEYNNGLYVDPDNSEVYSVAMDTADAIFTFRAGAEGNTEPMRALNIPHRGFQVTIDHERNELYSTNQYPPRLLVFRKGASGDEKPLRVIEGPKTGLADVHGVAVDSRRNAVFVGNWGNSSNHKVGGTGKHLMPSITVFTRDASGDAAPIRTIQGPKTRLNWMGALSLDPETGNLWVANDVDNSILVFRGTDNGDVAPMKMIRGDKTGLDHPAGIWVDVPNKEFWVTNMGNSTATAYSMNANGNTAPLRTIRTAPVGYKSVKFGKPQAVAYDSKREEYLVPN